jgi:hypothetical protein
VSLFDRQLNELSKGDKANSSPNRYNLRSKRKEGKNDVPDQRTEAEKPAKDVVDDSRGKKIQTPYPMVKTPIPEVKEIPKPTSPFNFEHEIQKIRIPVPLSKLVKHEYFKMILFKLLLPEPSNHPIDSINLQDERPAVILGPMVEDRDYSSPPLYTSLNIHDKVMHNCLMDSRASHNLMPKTVIE